LNAGVLAAKDVETRALRLATVEALADIELLSVDAATAMMWARTLAGTAGLRIVKV
jgi:hypothetical protein